MSEKQDSEIKVTVPIKKKKTKSPAKKKRPAVKSISRPKQPDINKEEIAKRLGDGKTKVDNTSLFQDRYELGEGYIRFQTINDECLDIGVDTVHNIYSPTPLLYPKELDFANAPRYRIVIERIK